ncbi:MAG: transcriptional regulator, TetR family [Chlorobi bacterium]|nr:transcriptional regulator, TetR family [Chlorobiota bacterium]
MIFPLAIDESALRTQILRTAQDQFFAHGFSKVTTDELAGALGISKKTLYQQFSSKDEMIRESIYLMRNEMVTEINGIVEDPQADFVEKLRSLMTAIGRKVCRMQRPFLDDLRRKMPELWKEIEDYRRERILTVFERLIAEGSQRGMLRKDVDTRLFVMMFFTIITNMINPTVLSDLPYTLGQVFQTFIRVMMEGVLTDEARQRYQDDGSLSIE